MKKIKTAMVSYCIKFNTIIGKVIKILMIRWFDGCMDEWMEICIIYLWNFMIFKALKLGKFTEICTKCELVPQSINQNKSFEISLKP